MFTRVERVLRAATHTTEPPAVAKLCRDRGFLKRSSDDAAAAVDAPASHNMYGNMHFMGVMHVPAGQPTRELAKAYVTDFIAGHYSAMTENKPDGAARFYIDYDLEFYEWPSEAKWRIMEALEKAALLKFYPAHKLDDAMFTSTVTSSGVTNVLAADGRAAFKVGIHVYYPNLYVTVEQALFLSTAILVALKQRFPDEPPGYWEKKLDQAVYGEGRGLRWVYQFKHCACACGAASKTKRKSSSAKADAAPRCTACAGCGYVPDVSSSMHAPLYRVTGFGNRTFFDAAVRHTPTVELMLECSLRAYERATPTDGFVRYATAAPIPLLLAAKTKRSPAGTTVACTGDALFNKWNKDADTEAFSDTSVEAQIIQAAIRGKDTHWANVRVKALFKRRSKVRSAYFKVQVQGEGSGYCLNYRQSHRSATVYFIVRSRGLIQKCTCRCVDVRVSGKPCSAFESTEFALTEDECALLFGNGAAGAGSFMVPVPAAVARAFVTPSVADDARTLPSALTPTTRFITSGTDVTANDSALTADASAGLAFGVGLTSLAPRMFGNPLERARILTLKRHHSKI